MAKILVVEDDTDIRSLIVDILLDMGSEVIEAGEGGMGLHKAVTECPDIILLDLWMPVMDGFQVLEKLKDNPGTQFTPVIMVTAKGQKEDMLQAMENGAWGYVTKPWDDGELESAVMGAEKQIRTGRQALTVRGEHHADGVADA
jgi:CheY-like chemotaxis protein